MNSLFEIAVSPAYNELGCRYLRSSTLESDARGRGMRAPLARWRIGISRDPYTTSLGQQRERLDTAPTTTTHEITLPSRPFNMNDYEPQCHSSDSEMLDDTAGDAYTAALASPLQVAHVVDEDALSEQAHCIGPVAVVENPNTYSLSDAVNGIRDGQNQSGFSRLMSPSHGDRASQPDYFETDVGSVTDVLARIESIFEAMLDVLLNERGQLSIAIITRPTSRRQRLESPIAHADSVQHICFPGKTEKEAWRFGQYSLTAC